MRDVLELAAGKDVTLASLFPDYAAIVTGGFELAGERLRFSAGRGDREAATIPSGVSISHWEWMENDIDVVSELPPEDSRWRAQIAVTILEIANQMMPSAVAVARYPVQVILFVNSKIGESIDESSSASGGLKFHQLHPSDPFDERSTIENYDQPTAIFTIDPSSPQI
jgi:hypothetical protein